MNLFKATLIGLDQFKKQLDLASKKAIKEVDIAIKESANEFAALAYQSALIDDSVFTRELVNSIDVKKEKPLQYIVVAAAPHAPFVEFGTKGNYKPQKGYEDIASKYKGTKPSNKFGTLFDSILAWVKYRNIGAQYKFKVVGSPGGDYIKSTKRRTKKAKQEQEQIAWAITLKIAKEGRKAKPFFYKNVVPVRTNLEKRIKEILNGL